MAGPEGNPIEGLGKAYTQKDSFMRVVRGFDEMHRRDMPPAELHAQAGDVFGAIAAQVPQRPYLPIYWLARAYPDLIPTAIPFIQRGARGEEEVADAQKKLDRLVEIDTERKHPVEYAPPESQIFTVSPQVERTIYNAIKYNDQGRPLLLMPMEDLPGIPGQLAVTVEQDGDRWGIALHLKSKEIDISEARKEEDAFREYTGIRAAISIGTKGESLALDTLGEAIKENLVLTLALGDLRFGKNVGWKQLQTRNVRRGLDTLPEAVPAVLGDDYSVREYSATQSIIENEGGEQYSVSVSVFEEQRQYGREDSIDGLTIRRFGGAKMPRLTENYGQFQTDLQRELRFASSMLSWLYQYSREDINYQINLQSPDFGLLDWMEGNSLIEKLSVSPNNFKDLGGNYDLRLAVEEDADQFVRSYKGERGALKPQNTILFGETGIGKTALENGIAAKLIEADVPVFVLKGDLFAQTMLEDPQEGVRHLKQMFYYLLMHGGAVMVRDFDALLGSRDMPEVNTIIEGVLLSELQRVKEDPSTWFVADTQFIGRISEALLNAHRIGKHREVPIETDQQGIEHIITAVVRKVDKEIHRRTAPLEFASIQLTYPFDIQALAAKIVDYGGMIPAQIERMVREEMQANATEGYGLETASLLIRVDAYVEERTRMHELRERQRAETLQATASEALQIAQAAMRRVTELEETLRTMREGVAVDVSKIRSEVRILQGDIAEKDASYSQHFAVIERQLGDLEARVTGGSAFSPKVSERKDDTVN